MGFELGGHFSKRSAPPITETIPWMQTCFSGSRMPRGSSVTMSSFVGIIGLGR